MNQNLNHPENFGPLIDRDLSDPLYEEIAGHLNECAGCRQELHNWQSVDALFRSADPGIDVPPFQWQRIAAQLREPAPTGILARFRSSLRPWKFAWNTGLATLALGIALMTGFQFYRIMETKELLLAVTRYANEEGERIGADGNPFRLAAASESNPFIKSPFSGDSKPSPDRR